MGIYMFLKTCSYSTFKKLYIQCSKEMGERAIWKLKRNMEVRKKQGGGGTEKWKK